MRSQKPKTVAINTSLKRGGRCSGDRNRFSGFRPAGKTTKAVRESEAHLPASLKRGVNESRARQAASSSNKTIDEWRYFLPYQIDWIRDPSHLKICEKSRQI